MPHATSPRIAPLPLDELDPDVRRLASLGADTVIQVLAHNPALMTASSGLGGYLLSQGRLHPRIRELAILRVALACEAPYEWANHVPAAFGAGATAEEINALSDPAAVWAPQDGAVLRAVDELYADEFVSDRTWADLSAAYDESEILELLFLVGFYRTMAGVLNSAGVQVNDGLPLLGQPVTAPETIVRTREPRADGGPVVVDGTWILTFTHPAGSKDIVVDLETTGESISGSLFDSQLDATATIVSGAVVGDEVSFEARLTDPVPFDIAVTGSIGGDVFTGSITISGGGTFPFSGTRRAS